MKWTRSSASGFSASPKTLCASAPDRAQGLRAPMVISRWSVQSVTYRRRAGAQRGPQESRTGATAWPALRLRRPLTCTAEVAGASGAVGQRSGRSWTRVRDTATSSSAIASRGRCLAAATRAGRRVSLAPWCGFHNENAFVLLGPCSAFVRPVCLVPLTSGSLRMRTAVALSLSSVTSSAPYAPDFRARHVAFASDLRWTCLGVGPTLASGTADVCLALLSFLLSAARCRGQPSACHTYVSRFSCFSCLSCAAAVSRARVLRRTLVRFAREAPDACVAVTKGSRFFVVFAPAP